MEKKSKLLLLHLKSSKTHHLTWSNGAVDHKWGTDGAADHRADWIATKQYIASKSMAERTP